MFAQTYTNYEVIAVNNRSPDTKGIERDLAPYLGRIVYIAQEGRGAAAARNTAVRAARGEWIVTLAPDDVWDPAYLETQIAFLDAHRGFDIYASTVVPEGATAPGETLMDVQGGVTIERLLTGGCEGFYGGWFARRDVILRVGCFDETLRGAEDVDLWLRIVAQGGRITWNTAAPVRRGSRDESLTADPCFAQPHILRVFEKARKTLTLSAEQMDVLDHQIDLVHARLSLLSGKSALAEGDLREARRNLEESYRTLPRFRLKLALLALRLAPWLAVRLAQRQAPGSSSYTRSASWILSARVFSFAISIALPLLLVRFFDRNTYGLYKLIFQVITTAVNIFPLGFAMSAYYFLPRERSRQGETILNILLVLSAVGILALLTLSIGPGILVFLSKDPAIIRYAPLIGAVILLSIVGSFLEIAPIANQEMQLATAAIILGQVIRTTLLLVAAIFVRSVAALIWAAIIFGCVQVMLLLGYLALRFPRFWSRFDRSLLSAQLSYSLPLGVAGLVYTFQTDLHNYFVSNRFGMDVYAIYAVGCFQIPLIQLFGDAAASVLIPELAHLQKEGQTDQIISLSLRAMRKLAAIIFPAYAFFMVAGREFITFLFTRQYQASWPIFAINLTLMPLSVLLLDPIIRAYAQYRYRIVQIRIASFVLLVTALWWATGRFGMIGAISSVVAIGALERTGMTWMFARILHFGARHLHLLRDIGKLALSATGAAAVAVGVRLLMLGTKPILVLLACGAVFAPAYLGISYVFRIADPDELAFLRRALRSPVAPFRNRLQP